MFRSSRNHQSATMGQSRSQRDWPGTLWVVLGTLLTAALLWNAFLSRWPGASPVVAASAGTPTARAEPGSVASRFQRRNIEDIRVGDRVLAHDPNPNGSLERVPTAVDPATWKRLRIVAEKLFTDGSRGDIQIESLQPPEWLRAHGVEFGKSVPLPLDLVEMGLPGTLRGRVVAIHPCPPLAEGFGAIVLTTVNQVSEAVLDLEVVGEDGRSERIGVTDRHQIWSQSRRGWVSAGWLASGEKLLPLHGAVDVVAVTRRHSTARVYNLTVEGKHVYHVSSYGVLVHNNNCGSATPQPGTTRHIELDPADNGGYRIEFESGMGYAGKGGTRRARTSARRLSREHNDPVRSIDHVPAYTDKDAYDIEATFLDELGGPESPLNFNQRNSPGTPF